MLESTFLEDWDEIGTQVAKKGHLLPKSGINSELVSIQKVKGIVKGFSYGLIDNDERVASFSKRKHTLHQSATTISYIQGQNSQYQSASVYLTKNAKKPYHWGRTYKD